ncbi:alkaline phosphatase PhoX [Novosphingobium panipatense]|jgi:secreted PhoX family phosphatase|uniref:PhoX family protein n=1 Tax=Novosphingobium TaxID=165696 RepID=UPI000CDA1B61|nr:PhoX family phosphatase [Novosphingobium sp. HII-3]
MNEADPAVTYTDGEVDVNDSTQRTLESMAAERYSRRQAMFRGAGATTMAFMGTGLLAACGDDDDDRGQISVTAGENAATSSGRVVNLTGTVTGLVGDTAPSWKQTSGPSATLMGTGSSVSFIAPAVATATDLVFTYTAVSTFGESASATTTIRVSPAALGFAAVAHFTGDAVVVPEGYTVTVVTRLGDPLAQGLAAYKNDGTDTDFDKRVGDHHDGLVYFGLSAAGGVDAASSTRGLLVQNHENITQKYLHAAAPSTGARLEAEVVKEMNCHGVSIVEYNDAGGRKWSYNQNSAFNRRITPFTPMDFHGPAAGSAMLRTQYSPEGTRGRGTINNCANGMTGWNTYLTCEENYAGYFRRDASDDALRTPRELASLRRNGVTSRTGSYSWSSANTTNTAIKRWNATISSATATSADDYRYEMNQMGWVVEIDPYNPNSTPRKRTALGRFGHEGAFVRVAADQKVGFYMGDDSGGEYLYKFVSAATWAAADANAADRLAIGDKYMDNGTLYAAVFNPDGTGAWKPLVYGQVPPRAPSTSYPDGYTFADQADICVNTRFAGDAVGATPMDRPEWTTGNPVTGEIYLTLTNNSGRSPTTTNAPNPRSYQNNPGTGSQGNPNGHIVRIREDGDTTSALTFRWDIYMFGVDSTDYPSNPNVNVSGLTPANDFSSPDGAFFSRATNVGGQINPLLWIETDDGAMTDRTNCMLLAALPGHVGDGGAVTIDNGGGNTQGTIVGTKATGANLRRFLVGPVDCEITGIDTTPDGRTMFVGVQHPGDSGTIAAPGGHWPAGQDGTTPTATTRPRSALVVITKNDGGVIGL